MCWIFGYKWPKNAKNILLHWLKKLEYRWYDSAWLTVVDIDWNIYTYKAVWKVWNLAEKINNNYEKNICTYGIAHTRWATHGGVILENTHPHFDENEKIYLVHNGIIENYDILKKNLENKWHKFYWQTDTEVIAKLLWENRNWDLLQTVENTLPMLEWAYALLVISKNNPWDMVWVKYWSPLVFGYNEEWEMFFSSDTQALAWLCENVIFLDDWDLVSVKNNDYLLKSEWKLIIKPIEKIDVQSLVAEKGDFKHFMLKEIFEQPKVLQDIFRGRIDFENKILTANALQELEKYNFEEIIFIWSGTSYHAGFLGTYWMEDIANIKSSVEVASELEFKNFKIDDNKLFVFISQSWETADSIEILKYIKNRGWKTLGIVNVVGSTISRLTDWWLFTRAGTEVWVASTKAFIAQITTILILTLYIANKRWLSNSNFTKILAELKKIPNYIQMILNQIDEIRNISKNLINYKNFFFLGRHYQLPIASEGSLKLKEISYLHSESYGAGELKHGPLALIQEDFPTIMLMPWDVLFEKNLSTLQEIKARNWKILAISDKSTNADWQISIPQTIDEIYPFLTVVVNQLLAYCVADDLWRDIDKPRNLAKSVTVK